MIDAYANRNSVEYEFHDLHLRLEREHEWIYAAQFEGVTILAVTNPHPTPEEIIDELLHKAKSVRNHPSRSLRLVENDES